uniref:EB domain-containing protein n=1 Tax=Heterorhabditis bacteriophora TaxID=37862 RepID=A0A1I7X0C4_HETBA
MMAITASTVRKENELTLQSKTIPHMTTTTSIAPTLTSTPLRSILPSSSTIKPAFWFKITKPGHPCDEASYCTNCSICVSGYCVCPEGLELLGERCASLIDGW